MLDKLLSSRSRWSYRALLAWLMTFGTAAAALWMDKLPAEQWVLLVQWTFAAFVGGETARRFAPAATPPREG